ncbi:DUF4079 domain-containing protein [Candidatus Atelocyanobacterium thalassae]|uniref:DUF4079 domain-containing protein n=1 Tax=cyanobacterium endosymbiont of Braarudosphaera bigelowii TaxID=1285375 RepID=A0ABM7U4J0_9CHRO|nr:DUF4079 domain-containing protein [Candidatus Atelocyanobacterium thalassa]BDA39270.1 hypothetical protein CPARK_000010900 [cyanobacterium endosymbiont of Braarudosphaera bigelowii]
MVTNTSEFIKFWSQFSHPIIMLATLLLLFYVLYLGLQLRYIRTSDKQIRKELIEKKNNNRHYQLGALLLNIIVLGNLGGMAITYVNNDKLFFSPHLLVGLTITGLVTTSTSLVPFMQKGNDLARHTHMILNFCVVILFSWQVISGIEIVQKIIENISITQG